MFVIFFRWYNLSLSLLIATAWKRETGEPVGDYIVWLQQILTLNFPARIYKWFALNIYIYLSLQCICKHFLNVLRKSGHEISETETRALNSFPFDVDCHTMIVSLNIEQRWFAEPKFNVYTKSV